MNKKIVSNSPQDTFRQQRRRGLHPCPHDSSSFPGVILLTFDTQINASKTDALLKEHPGKPLDELVAARLLNNDQKAQILKKPALQSQLAQLEEQVAQYKKVDADYRARLTAEKEKMEKDLVERLEKDKADAVRKVKEKADADAKHVVHDNFLVLSQFLRLAAARRAEEADPTLDENAALEGVLLAVYGGDELAVRTMLKLVEGSEETTVGTGGEQLETTCKLFIPSRVVS